MKLILSRTFLVAVLFAGAAFAVYWQGFAQQNLWTQFATVYVVLWYLQFGWKCFYLHSKGRWVDRQTEFLMRKIEERKANGDTTEDRAEQHDFMNPPPKPKPKDEDDEFPFKH